MKKIIFGLLLTVGFSTVAFANTTIKNDELKESSKELTKTQTIEKVIEKTVSKEVVVVYKYNGYSCTITGITKYYDSCGNYDGSSVDYTYEASGSACGDSDGGAIMKISRMNTGLGDCWIG